MHTVRLDIVSDVVCPWCLVGFLQLQQALQQTGVRADVHWQPFELNPEMPEEGEHLDEHLQKKYGSDDAQRQSTRDQLTALGNTLGFQFSFADDMRIVNTFDAHQLLHWAAVCGRQHELKMTLFHCYFARGRDVSDRDVLANAAVEAGLDFEQALEVLEDQRYAKAVRESQRVSLGGGIKGVPAVIVDQRELIVGAQGVERYQEYLSKRLTS